MVCGVEEKELVQREVERDDEKEVINVVVDGKTEVLIRLYIAY